MKIEAPNKRLKELQALPLERKVGFTIARITEWNIYYKENTFKNNCLPKLSEKEQFTALDDSPENFNE